jgi:hypothetical protein
MDICKSLIEDLSKYSIKGLSEFLEADTSIQLYELEVFEGDIKHASIWVTVTPRYIQIGAVERHSEKRGIAAKLLKLIACKAIQLRVSVKFTAEPRFMQKNLTNGTKLFKYYNNLGFTRAGSSDYNTSVNNLKKIVNKTRKTRRRKN